MSYATSKYYDFGKTAPFSGGIIDNQQSYLLESAYTPYGRNFRVEWWSISIRPWYSLLIDYSTGWYPKGIGSYLRASSTNDRLLVYQNSKVKSLTTAGVSTDCTGITFTGTSRMNFTNTGDVCYCMNWTDQYTKLSGTTLTQPAAVPASFAPSYGVIFNNTMWASWWATNSNNVYRSVPSTFDDFNATWSGNVSFNEQITWLCANLESIFFFTKNSVAVTTKGDITQSGTTFGYAIRWMQVQEWAACHNSIVWAWNAVFFLTPSNKIMMIQKWASNLWFDTIDLTHRKNRGIEKIMNSLDPDQSNSFGYYVPSTNLCKWYFKSYGATFNDTCVVYSVNYDTFYVDTNKNFYDGVMFNGVEYTCSNIEPKVYIDEYGQTDDDQAIQFEYQTKSFAPSWPTTKNELWESKLFGSINELAELTQEVYVDGAKISTDTINSSNIPLITWGIWTNPVWDWAIGSYNPKDSTDMFDIYKITTKGKLQKKWFFFVWRYTCATLAAKVSLRNLSFRSETLAPQAVKNQS